MKKLSSFTAESLNHKTVRFSGSVWRIIATTLAGKLLVAVENVKTGETIDLNKNRRQQAIMIKRLIEAGLVS
jgi:hypothetical protein